MIIFHGGMGNIYSSDWHPHLKKSDTQLVALLTLSGSNTKEEWPLVINDKNTNKAVHMNDQEQDSHDNSDNDSENDKCKARALLKFWSVIVEFDVHKRNGYIIKQSSLLYNITGENFDSPILFVQWFPFTLSKL